MADIENAVWDAEELTSIRNCDRILPSQPYFSKMYKGNPVDYFQSLESVILSPLQYEKLEDKFNIKLKDGMNYAAMGSELSTLSFYQMLIRLGGYKNVLELGTYVGVSALFFAEAVGENGRVVTVELGEEFYQIAKKNIENNGYSRRIKQLKANALDAVNEMVTFGHKYDFIFIDAAKESYDRLFELSLGCLSDNGIIIVDDVFFQGDTLNDVPTSEKGRGVRRMLDNLRLYKAYHKVILPIGNGMLMVRKISA